MYRLHLTRNLRSLGFLLTFAAAIVAVSGLWWANHTGLPGPWRATIEQEAAKQGAFIQIGSLSYAPFRGVVATDVRVFSEPSHRREISRLEAVVLDFDKTKLARGIFHLNKVELNHARMVLPVDPDNPDSEILHISDASGALYMPGERRLEIRSARGKIAGIEVSVNARLIGYHSDGKSQSDDPNIGKRRQLLARIIGELEKWSFDENHPPAIHFTIEGDVNNRSSITAKLSLEVRDMEKNGHRLDEVSGEADMTGDILTVTSLRASDRRGRFQGHIDYNLLAKEGRFDVVSSLEIPSLLTAWLGMPTLSGVQISGKQALSAEGEFQMDESNQPKIQMTGHVRCEAVKLRSVPFDAVDFAFSWREDRTYLRDLQLVRPDGEAAGKAIIEWPLVRLELHTTLPIPVYRPFFVGQPLEKVLNDLSERENAAVDLSLAGGFDLTNRLAWAYTGSGTVKNLNYRGVPVNSAGCKFSLNHHELDFYEGKVVFNYSDYALRKTFSGAEAGTASVGRIRFDAREKVVHIEDVRGEIWAAPMVRFFAPKVADSLEQYRFHQPPEMSSSGVVDITPQGRTNLDVSFSSDQSADYVFLGSNVTLGSPSARVTIQGERVLVRDLKLEAFDGPVAGEISYLGKGRLEGELNWTRLSIPDLASTYGFQMKGGGDVTGRIRFSLNDNKVESMAGSGLLALENAELFSVPMFGPLTPLVGGVLNDDNAGIQRAKDAFCTFEVKDGILTSRDFQTSTSSLNFAGNGSVDMKQQTLDMTMRLNARGLLGILTRPLRPFSGLFQFHGSGPLKATRWESMKFTEPPGTENEILLAPPRARAVPITY
jgi:AsmA-like C-terminal region